MVHNLHNYARSVVEKKSKEEVWKVQIRMKERFSTVFDFDNNLVRRVWTEKEDIGAIREAARSASLKLLAVMVAIRLDEKADKVDGILFSSLMDGTATTDLLALNSWEEVPPEATLITALQCKSLWRQFKVETKPAVTEAIFAQNAYIKKLARGHLPSQALSHFVGAAAGAATGAATVAVAGAVGFFAGGPVLGVPAGVSLGVSAGVAVTSAVAGALGVPEAADIEVILRRNKDMLARND